MKRIPSLAALLSITAVLAVISSCKGRDWTESLVLEPNPVLTAGIGYGLVLEEYARIKDAPGPEGKDEANARRGDVVMLTGRTRIEGEGSGTGLWYAVEGQGYSGWLSIAFLSVYKSRAEAERAAGELR